MVATLKLTVREALQSDLERVLAIEYACFPDPYPLSLLKKLRAMYFETFLVAEVDEKIVGYLIGAVRWGNIGHILAIGVEPFSRKKGIGAALMKETLERFKRKGARTARLEVRKSNVGAQEFYHRLGFVDRFEVPYYYEDGEAAQTMELNLF